MGPDSDYPFVLHLGEKLRRSLRLANPRLTFLQRTYEGAYSLLVECAWRVDAPGHVVGSCWDVPDVRRAALDRLVGQNAVTVRAEPPGYDLEMVFEDGHALRCLSVETDLQRSRDNWHLYSPSALLRVGPRSRPDFRTAEEARAQFQRLRLALIGESDDPLALQGRPRRGPSVAPERTDPPDNRPPSPDGPKAPSESSPTDTPRPITPLRPVEDPPT